MFVLDAIRGWPHAPWWVPEDGGPASLITTGMIAGTLHASGIRHPWLDRATALVWSRADDLASAGGYDMRGLIRFLNHVPDRDRAEEVLDRAGQVLRSRGLVALDPGAPGEVMTPLDFAPLPGSRARRLFSDATIEAQLDHLAAGQADDGGWTFNWPAWSPAAERDWRGSLTVDALHVLRAHGRLAS